MDKLKKLYMSTFNTKSGKAVIEDLEMRCFKYKPTYQGDRTQAFINEGMRLTLLHIETMLSKDSEGEENG